MEVRAKAKFIKMSQRKTRLVADVVRGLEVNEALNQLKFINKKAALPIAKLINSAVANAENNFELKKDNLKIKEIRVDEGPTMHRWMPRARGRATPIRKRSSHINLVLAEIVESGQKEAKKQKIEAPIKLGQEPKNAGDPKIPSGQSKEKEASATGVEKEEKDKKISREEERVKHADIEGGAKKGFVNKIFRRKSG